MVMLSLAFGILASIVFTACGVSPAYAGYTAGAWDNFEFNQPASYWTSAVREYSGSGGVLDLVVAQTQGGYTALPFSFPGTGTIIGAGENDLAEPYLAACDRDGISVILSIQPSGADVNDLINIILGRYGHHSCIIGINIDLEWKKSGTPLHANNQERDAWTAAIRQYSPGMKLFLTYFGDYTYFPDDDGNMVVLYDGQADSQENILKAYGELARHYANVGIYTGYSSSHPQTVSDEMILNAAPNTRYIIHTDDLKSKAKASITQTTALPSSGSGIGDMPGKISLPSAGSLSSGLSSNGFSMPSITSGMDSGFTGFSSSIRSGSASGTTENPASAGAGSEGFIKSSSFPDIGGRYRELSTANNAILRAW